MLAVGMPRRNKQTAIHLGLILLLILLSATGKFTYLGLPDGYLCVDGVHTC